MTSSTCPDNNVLEQFLLGFAAERGMESLEDHVSSCPSCASRMARLKSDDPLVRTVRGARDLPEVPHAQLMRAMLPMLKCLRPRELSRTLSSDGTEVISTEGYTFSFLRPPSVVGDLGSLGSYRIREILGSGGMGVVFRAYDSRLNRDLAVKVIRPEMGSRPGAVERFLQEARSAAAVEHENIVTVYQADEQDGIPFLAMPLLRGESLEDRLRGSDEPLPIDEVLRIGRETAQGLAAAHERGLIHRDIKPANLWVEAETGRIKILDFGLAQVHGSNDEVRAAGGIAGTPAYMAPEQAQGHKLDGRADLFSLGCVLYRAATGNQPFVGHDTLGILCSVLSDHPKPPSEVRREVPKELCDLISDLLAKKPEERIASAQDVVKRIEAIEQRKRDRLRPWWRVWLTAAACGLALGLSLWAWLGNRPEQGIVPTIDPVAITFDYDEPDGRLLVIGGDCEQVVDPSKERTLALLPGEYTVRPVGETTRRLVPDRLTVEKDVPTTMKFTLVGEISRHELHQGSVQAIAHVEAADKVTVFSAGLDRRVCRWEPNKGEKATFYTPHGFTDALKQSLPPLRSLATSIDGKLIAFAGGERLGGNNAFRVWETATAKNHYGPRFAHTGMITALAFHPSGNRFATGATDGSMMLWDFGREQLALGGHVHPDIELGRLGLNGIAFSPDGRHLLRANGDGSVMLLMLPPDGGFLLRQTLKDAHPGGTYAVAFVPEASAFVSAGKDGVIRIWDEKTFKARELKGHEGTVFSVSLSADGKRLLSGGADGTIRLWDVETGQLLTKLEGHNKAVNSMALTADGRRAFSGGADATVRYWQLPR